MDKVEKMINIINEKFGIYINMSRAGGRFVVTPEKGHTIDSKKMAEVREYVSMHSEELEEDDDS